MPGWISVWKFLPLSYTIMGSPAAGGVWIFAMKLAPSPTGTESGWNKSNLDFSKSPPICAILASSSLTALCCEYVYMNRWSSSAGSCLPTRTITVYGSAARSCGDLHAFLCDFQSATWHDFWQYQTLEHRVRQFASKLEAEQAKREAMLAEKDEHRKLLVVNARKLKTRCDFQISTLKSQLAEAKLYLEAERARATLQHERLAMAAADTESNECRRWELAYVLTVSDGCAHSIEVAREFAAEVVERLDDDVEASMAEVDAGHAELVKAQDILRGNRALFVKVFAVLVVLIVLVFRADPAARRASLGT